MSIINPENYFYVSNGAVLRDLNETLFQLKEMDQETFSHHVNSSKNDFSNWIKDVLSDEKLAKKINQIKDKNKIVSIIENSLKPTKKSKSNNKKAIILSIKKRISHGE